MNAAALIGELLADVHARTVRAYEAVEDGDPSLAADLLLDLAHDLAVRRAALEGEAE